MKQKIIKVGNSYAVTIPKKFLKEIEYENGGTVEVHLSVKDRQAQYVFTDKKKNKKHVVDPEVYAVGKRLIEEYHDAFEELAKK